MDNTLIWQTLITTVSATVVTVVLAILQHRMKLALKEMTRDTTTESARASRDASRAALKVEEVKQDLKEASVITGDKFSTLTDIAEKTHILVNNNMLIQLQLNAILARRIANRTNEPSDIQAADLAEKNLHDHKARQSKVDIREIEP